MSAMCKGEWNRIRSEDGKRVELYNLESDPLETTDMAESQPRKVQELGELWKEIRIKDKKKESS
ncbi:MAG: hypothetical protein C4527_00520 [Candidatus Omnitrophota bacterium]|jgi:arylsulfatase A-like enzyme|nr:MAG: hypothetical protein C4527_00520 [Candidatus Omnitrophota bacterium]